MDDAFDQLVANASEWLSDNLSKEEAALWEPLILRKSAHINGWRKNPDWWSYGFKQAADLLARESLAQRGRRDYLLPVIAHLYRHYIELELKALLLEMNSEAEVQERGHSLLKLWRAFCVQYAICKNDKLVQSVEAGIMHLHRLDPNGDLFRYATTKKGDFFARYEIDLKQLIVLADWFETISFGTRSELS